MPFWDSKQVAITGGLGFVGSNLTRRLLEEGAEVTIIDIVRSDEKLETIAEIREEVTVVDSDVRNKERISGTVTDADVVYHLASQNSRLAANDNPRKNLEINCMGLLNVLEAARESRESARVVYASSLATVGNPGSPIDETTKSNPVDIYGVHKRAAEHYCRLYNRLNSVPTTVFRPANVYGPRAPLHDTGYGVINQFIGAALQDKTLSVFKPGETTRDFIFISDVVDALVHLGRDRQAVGEIYVLGTGEETTIKELAESVVEIAGSGSVDLVPWPEEWEQIRRGDIVTDPSKIQTEIGWSPEVDLEEGIKRTVEFFRSER